MGGRRWTQEEDGWLRENYATLGAEQCAKASHLDRSYNAIALRACKLGLQERRGRWTEDEDNWLRKHYVALGARGSIEAGYLSRTSWAIRTRVSRLGITADRDHSEAVRAAWARGDYDGIHTEEWRRKQSEAQKAVWESGVYDKEWREGQSEALKRRWMRGDLDNLFTEEVRQKMSEGVKSAWVRGDYDGIHDNDETRCRHAEAARELWASGRMDGVFQSPTSIEIQIAAALDDMNIEHETQYRPDGYSRIYDEFVPPNTLIEVQGDYWHGDDFPKTQRRDAEKAQWATDNGYELIVIWEHEIKEQGARSLLAERVERRNTQCA